MFKQQHCGQVTWPRPISSHMWLSGKERERKLALNPVWAVGTSVQMSLWSTQTPLRSSSRPAPPAPSCCLWRATRPWTPPASPWPPTGGGSSAVQSWEWRPSRELRHRFDSGSSKDKPFLSYLTLWQEHQPRIFLKFPIIRLSVQGCSGENQFCGVHSPGVCTGTDGKRHLPAANTWFWHRGDKNNQAGPFSIPMMN